MIEQLEGRRLLAFTATLSNGSLNIRGAGDSNDLQVVENQGQVTIIDNSTNSSPSALFNGVTGIQLWGNTGNDKLLYRGNSIGANIRSNSGADEITVRDEGTGSSDVDGEADNDNIIVVIGHGTHVSGGSGDDTIQVSTGAINNNPDMLNFANAETIVLAGSGNDTITIWDGQNTINGGAGYDVVYANGGNNTYTKVEVVN
jgi:Ca2+-binding RTX toxin-like protein